MILEKEKVIIKSSDLVSAGEVLNYQIRNKNFMKEYEPVRNEEFYTLDFWEKILIEDMQYELQDKSYHFYIYPKSNPEILIGFIGLSNILRGDFQSCFIGYQLDKDYINKGYMSEAVNTVVEYAFEVLNLHRIEANIMPHNKRSFRVVEKCNFENEGLSKKYLKINAKWQDHYRMVRINYKWKENICDK